MQTNSQNKYTYENAGFNGLLSRSKVSNPFAQTLADGASNSTGTAINLDQQQLFGALGNILAVGTITIDGVNGKISIHDASGNEVGRLGDLSV